MNFGRNPPTARLRAISSTSGRLARDKFFFADFSSVTTELEVIASLLSRYLTRVLVTKKQGDLLLKQACLVGTIGFYCRAKFVNKIHGVRCEHVCTVYSIYFYSFQIITRYDLKLIFLHMDSYMSVKETHCNA